MAAPPNGSAIVISDAFPVETTRVSHAARHAREPQKAAKSALSRAASAASAASALHAHVGSRKQLVPPPPPQTSAGVAVHTNGWSTSTSWSSCSISVALPRAHASCMQESTIKAPAAPCAISHSRRTSSRSRPLRAHVRAAVGDCFAGCLSSSHLASNVPSA